MRSLVLLLAGLFSAGICSAAPAQAGAPIRPPVFLAFENEETYGRITADAFYDVPGLVASFELAAPGCITATFSLNFLFEDSRDRPGFKVLLDGILMHGHSPVDADPLSPWSDFRGAFNFGPKALLHVPIVNTPTTISYTLWECGVPSGPHTVRVQWGDPDDVRMVVRARSLIVQAFN